MGISHVAGKDGKAEIKNNAMSFVSEGTHIFCVWDVNADRMRLVTPIAEAKDIPAEYIILALRQIIIPCWIQDTPLVMIW